MEFVDKILHCIDCGSDFVFTAGEQLFFHDKNFVNEPKRCKGCKTKRVTSLSGQTLSWSAPSAHQPDASRFAITFDSKLSPVQMKATLEVLADYYRACGGAGFEITWEIEDLRLKNASLSRAAFRHRLEA